MSINLTSFEWLLSDQNDPKPATDNPVDAEALPPCPNGQIQMEQIPVLGNSVLYLFKAQFNEAATLCANEGGSGSHLGLILTQAGNYQLHTEGCGQPCDVDRNAVVLQSPGQQRVDYYFPVGERIDAMAFTLGRESLNELLGSDRPPKLLADWLESRSGMLPFARQMAASAGFADITRQLAHSPYQGAARRLFCEAKALEGFAELLHRLDGGGVESRTPSLTSWERSRVFEAREVLMERVADPPGLSELADLVGLPTKRLDRLFREVFGATPFGWVRDYRLTLAKQLLTEESLPIKQVAHRLGYANVHNFTHAFTARFGVSPGALRGRGKGVR